MLKKLTKVVITPLLSQLRLWPGWQKNGVFVALRLIEFKKRKKIKIFDDFFFNLDGFCKFTQFWLNLRA